MEQHIAAAASQAPVAPPGALTAARYGGLGVLALLVAHCAGMVDLVALPVWVGTLIGDYHLDPQQAGSIATLFLAGAVASSVWLSPRLNRLHVRLVAPLGFGVAAVVFVAAAAVERYALIAGLHAVAGMAVGSSLSVTHGAIGRSQNPHRLFAIAGLSLGCFAIAFLGVTPGLIAAHGGRALFQVFAVVMAVASITSAVAFPAFQSSRGKAAGNGTAGGKMAGGEAALDRAVWYGMVGVACMGLTQAMTFSFLQRIGLDRGFGFSAVTGVLVALGLVNLIPAPLAGFLEARLPAVRVVQIGPAAQAALAATIALSGSFAPYAIGASVFAAVMIFTHTFAFGLLARLDETGRCVAATPAMLMTGAALGPILGGTLVKHYGYGSLAVGAAVIAAAAIACFSRLPARVSSGGHVE